MLTIYLWVICIPDIKENDDLGLQGISIPLIYRREMEVQSVK